ncbi:MAG: hypothetical protein LC746_14635, partial [Acidobacteria bacterium]|nr:hypothetical protein [Acidobacteriota bacterium]
MTGEEMERAIEFLLKHQADFDVRLNRLSEEVGRLTGGVGETNKQLRLYAETQTEFMQVVTQFIEGQSRINAEQARINTEFRATTTRIANAL